MVQESFVHRRLVLCSDNNCIGNDVVVSQEEIFMKCQKLAMMILG
jgi:hypothetical protein